MKKLIIIANRTSAYTESLTRVEIYYINRPNLRNYFKFKMNMKKEIYFLTDLFAPYFYYESTGFVGSVGYGYSELQYGGYYWWTGFY